MSRPNKQMSIKKPFQVEHPNNLYAEIAINENKFIPAVKVKSGKAVHNEIEDLNTGKFENTIKKSDRNCGKKNQKNSKRNIFMVTPLTESTEFKSAAINGQ